MQNSWNQSLNQLLSQQVTELSRLPRIAVIGVGNPLRCDDAAGILVARVLSAKGLAAHIANLFICEAGQAPENWTGRLREFVPDLILIVDAADMGKEAGTIQWIPEECIESMSASTHSLPLSMLARYLTLELGCKVLFLGIQPASIEIGEMVSPQVLRAVDETARGLVESIRGCIASCFPA